MVQKTAEAPQQKTEVVDEDLKLKAAQDAGKAALDSVDVEGIEDLLKDIDDVLETNAQEFVASFIQKGGE